jgi:glutathione S-transferase
VKLYYHHFQSPHVRKVRAVAFQLELALEEIQIDWGAKAHLLPDYLALNPNAKFPTLVDGDFVLWESNAICQYLAAQRPEAGLLPQDERGRADVTRWQFWELAHFSEAAARLIGHSMGRAIGQPIEAVERDFRRWAQVLDGHLRGRRFLVGDGPTVADFCAASMLMYAELGEMPLADYPEIARWFAAVEQLPGWIRSRP